MATTTADYNPALWVWGEKGIKPRFLHTMIRVKNFDDALRFYIDGLGMKVLDRFDIEVSRNTLMFLGFEGYDAGGCVELVHPWDAQDEYTHGTGYGHISVGVPNVGEMLKKLTDMGFKMTRPITVLIKGGPEVAFVADSDGYQVELIQTERK
jgi:lactoylglutathione lyase